MDRGVQNLQPLHTPHTIITTASKILIFSVADTQLYKKLCPSVLLSVGPSVRRSVGRPVTLELKTRETRIYDAAVVIEYVWVYVSV